MRLSMKQLIPTSLDEYIAEHKAGDVVIGRVIDESGMTARVELGEGIQANCRVAKKAPVAEQEQPQAKADLSSLSSMLAAKWKGGSGSSQAAKPEEIRTGQVRSFRITKLDAESKSIEVELA